LEVNAPSLPLHTPNGHSYVDEALTLILRRKFLQTRWIQTLSLVTNHNVLAAEDVEKHGSVLRLAGRQCNWSFMVPSGLSRPRRKHEFNELLPLPGLITSKITSSASAPAPKPVVMDNPDALLTVSKSSGLIIRSHKRKRGVSPWFWLLLGFVIATFATAFYVRSFQESQDETPAPSSFPTAEELK